MQNDTERILNNLHVLAALSHNDKLMTNGGVFDIYVPTSMRGLFRTWYGERRMLNIAHVRECIRMAMHLSQKSLEDTLALLNTSSPRCDQMRLRIDTHAMRHLRMLEGLSRSRQGLQNMMQTYRDDAASASNVQLLMEEIEDFLRAIHPHAEKLREHCSHVDGIVLRSLATTHRSVIAD